MTGELARLLDTLRARRSSARNDFGLEIVGVTGSWARGNPRPDSDVDVVLRIIAEVTLYDLVRLREMLEADLGRPIDLILSEDLRPERRAYLERDLVEL